MTWLTNPYRFGAPVVPIGTRKYWRLLILSAPNSQTSIARLQMAATPAGPDLCTGGTPTAGATSVAVANAFDANASTYWGSSATSVTWNYIQYEFAAPVSIAEVRISTRNDAFYTDAPRVFAVMASSDGTNWTSAQIIYVSSAWTSAATQTFAVSLNALPTDRASAFMWGIGVTAVASGTAPYIAEMELALTASGADQCSGGFPFHKAIFQNSESSDKLFDNSGSTLCRGVDFSSVATQDFGYIFPAPIAPVELRLRAFNNFTLWTSMAKDFTIWWSADGQTRNVVATITNQTWTTGEVKAFAIP